MWRAASAVGSEKPHDNGPLVSRILALRAEKAALLGREHFADLVLSRRMAKTGATAIDFIEDLRGRCSVAFARECRELEESKVTVNGAAPARLCLLYTSRCV